MPDSIAEYVPHAIALASLLLSTLAAGHALMYKRESRAAAAWVGLLWLSPLSVLNSGGRVPWSMTAAIAKVQDHDEPS